MSTSESSKKNVCIIDLERVYENLPNQDWRYNSMTPHKRQPQYSLHQDLAIELTKKVWKALIKNAEASIDNWANGWTNLNFFISGGRGSGKSTFLRYVTHCITDRDAFSGQRESIHWDKRIPHIHELFFCDPTAMTSRENFFVSIVAAINDFVKHHTSVYSEHSNYVFMGGAHNHSNEKGELDGNHSHQFFMSTPGQSNKEILDRISKLARGIALLEDSYNSNSSDLDPESQLQLGILNSNKALNLKRNFDEIINLIATAYGLDGFLIAIDDADIECTKNKKIIETIRTYLTHPRIILLFTGDQILTHETIRQKQFEQFSSTFHEIDASNKARRLGLTNDMAAQYLKKIFPVSNHIALYTLYEAIATHNCTYILRFVGIPQANQENLNVGEFRQPGTPRNLNNLRTFVREAFRNSISDTLGDTKVFCEAFLRLPLRSILLILRYWNDNGVYYLLSDLRAMRAELSPMRRELRELKAKIKSDLLPPEDKILVLKKEIREKQIPLVEKQEELSRILAESFKLANYNELLSKGFTRMELELSSIYGLSKGILRHCINCGNLTYGYHLATSAIRFNNQESALGMATKAANLLHSYGNCFTYSLFSAFTAKVYKHYQQNIINSEGEQNSNSYDPARNMQYSQFVYERFSSYLFSNDSDNPVRWAKKISLICVTNHGKKDEGKSYIDKGVFHLTHEADARLISLIFKNLTEELNGEKYDQHTFLAYMTMVILCGQTNGPHNIYYLSALNFMGFMARCYTQLKNCADDDSIRVEKAAEILNKTIDRFIQTNIEPNWSHSASDKPTNIHISKHTPKLEARQNGITELARGLNAWYKMLNECCHMRTPSIGRIADSLYQLISDTSNELTAYINSEQVNRGGLACAFPYIIPQLEVLIDAIPPGGGLLATIAEDEDDKNASNTDDEEYAYLDEKNDYAETFVDALKKFPIVEVIKPVLDIIKKHTMIGWEEVKKEYARQEDIKDLHVRAQQLPGDIQAARNLVSFYFNPVETGRESDSSPTSGILYRLKAGEETEQAFSYIAFQLDSLQQKILTGRMKLVKLLEEYASDDHEERRIMPIDIEKTADSVQKYINEAKDEFNDLKLKTAIRLHQKLKNFISNEQRKHTTYTKKADHELNRMAASIGKLQKEIGHISSLDQLRRLLASLETTCKSYQAILDRYESFHEELSSRIDFFANNEDIKGLYAPNLRISNEHTLDTLFKPLRDKQQKYIHVHDAHLPAKLTQAIEASLERSLIEEINLIEEQTETQLLYSDSRRVINDILSELNVKMDNCRKILNQLYDSFRQDTEGEDTELNLSHIHSLDLTDTFANAYHILNERYMDLLQKIAAYRQSFMESHSPEA